MSLVNNVPKLGVFDGEQLSIIRDLSQEEYILYANSTQKIETFFKNSNLYQIFIISCSALREYLLGQEKNRNLTPLMEAFERDEILCDANRKLLTCISAFKAFIDQTGHYYSSNWGNNSEEYRLFENLRKNSYSENFSYRLFYELRNYVQHCELPINHFEDRKPILSKQQFIDDQQVKASFRRELECLPNEIDLLSELGAFVDCISIFFGNLIHIELPALINCVNFINKILLVGKVKSPTLATYIISKVESINGKPQYTLELPKYEYLFMIKQLEVLGNYDPLLTAAAIFKLRKSE